MKNNIIYILSRTLLGRLILFSFSKTFKQEFKESLQAKILFNENKKSNKNIFLLRRNIHRIEKGLCSPNRREIFALGFIKPTVTNFIGLISDEFYKMGAYDNNLKLEIQDKATDNREYKYIAIIKNKNILTIFTQK